MIAIVPVLALILGLILYVLPTNPKMNELGRLTFACGTLVFLFALADHAVRVFPAR